MVTRDNYAELIIPRTLFSSREVRQLQAAGNRMPLTETVKRQTKIVFRSREINSCPFSSGSLKSGIAYVQSTHIESREINERVARAAV